MRGVTRKIQIYPRVKLFEGGLSKDMKHVKIWRNYSPPCIDRGTWKNFELVPLGGGWGVAKYELKGVEKRKDMKHDSQ